MKRGIITNNGHGIHISDGEVWMTAWEIADLFYTTAGVINSRIKAILKANILKKYDICQCIKLENGNSTDVYNLNMIIALSYQIDTGHSAAFRKWLINKVASKQKGISLFIPIMIYICTQTISIYYYEAEKDRTYYFESDCFRDNRYHWCFSPPDRTSLWLG